MRIESCPNRQQLTEYISGDVDEPAADILSVHVHTCTKCQSTLHGITDHEDTFISALKQGCEEGPYDREPELLQALESAMEMIGEQSASASRVSKLPASREPITDGSTHLGQYRLLELLGQGGMGTVYRAEHTRLEMIVAVKVLSDRLVNDPQALARFDREMKAVGKVNHPNIVRATDAGEEDGRHFLAMEYVDGSDLSQVLRIQGALRIADACAAIRQAATGIQHAHELGLIHRDIKPSNLMVTKDGTVKVLDLGLARLQNTSAAAELTGDLQIMGTADFIAPEQAMTAKEIDHRADIYSLGCTLYTLLTGSPPFSGEQYDTPLKKLMAHSQEPPIAAQLRRPEIPGELSLIIARALEKLPADRFETAIEFSDAISQFEVDAQLRVLGELGEHHGSIMTPQEMDRTTSNVFGNAALTDTASTQLALSSSPSSPVGANRRGSRATIRAMAIVGAVVLSTLTTLFFAAPYFVPQFFASNPEAPGNTPEILAETAVAPAEIHPTPTVPNRNNDGNGAATTNDIEPTTVATKSLDRQAAEYALAAGGAVDVLVDGVVSYVNSPDQLPVGNFTITNVISPNEHLPSDEQFARLAKLRQLTQLRMRDLAVTDHLVARLATLPLLSNLQLYYDQVLPTGLEKLSGLPMLLNLTVQGDQVGDEELAVVCANTRVPHLTINSSQTTDESLSILGEASHLRLLSLIHSRIEGTGIVHLAKLPSLESLHLPYSPTNDAALKHIAQLRQMKWLNLDFTKVTNVEQLSTMPNLVTLEVAYTAVKGHGIASLKTITSLRQLRLQATQINDDSLEALAQLTQLTELNVGDRLSAAAVQQLRSRLPNCTIVSTTAPQARVNNLPRVWQWDRQQSAPSAQLSLAAPQIKLLDSASADSFHESITQHSTAAIHFRIRDPLDGQ